MLDSDIIFYTAPYELIHFFERGTTDVDMLYLTDMQDAYIARVDELSKIFHIHIVPRLNSGIIALKRQCVGADYIYKYYRTVREEFHKKNIHIEWMEQTGYAIIASKIASSSLPHTYAIHRGVNPNTVCRHYVHDIRKFYLIDVLTHLLIPKRV